MTSAHVQHLVVLAHIRCVRRPPGSGPAEQRKKKDSDRNPTARRRAYGGEISPMSHVSNPYVQAPNLGNHTRGREREKGEERRERSNCVKEGAPLLPLYSRRGVCHLASLSHVGLNPMAKGVAGHTMGQVAHGATPSPLFFF